VVLPLRLRYALPPTVMAVRSGTGLPIMTASVNLAAGPGWLAEGSLPTT
jgi:hypothetical protein